MSCYCEIFLNSYPNPYPLAVYDRRVESHNQDFPSGMLSKVTSPINPCTLYSSTHVYHIKDMSIYVIHVQ